MLGKVVVRRGCITAYPLDIYPGKSFSIASNEMVFQKVELGVYSWDGQKIGEENHHHLQFAKQEVARHETCGKY